jgi:hypothetical protein
MSSSALATRVFPAGGLLPDLDRPLSAAEYVGVSVRHRPNGGFMSRIVVSLTLALALASAQDWMVRYSTGQYHNDEARAVAADSFGNCYVVGYGDPDQMVVIKYDPNGDTLWTRTDTRGGQTGYSGMAAAAYPDGSLVAAVNVRQDTFNGFHVMKLDAGGALQWDTVCWHSHSSTGIGLNAGIHMILSPSGSIYLTGTAKSPTTSTDALTCKLNQSGGTAWVSTLDGQRHSFDVAGGLRLDATGNVFVAASLTDAANRYNATAIKYDSLGNRLWYYQYATSSTIESWGTDIAVAGTSAYLVGNWRTVTLNSHRTIILRLNSGGDTVWSRSDSSEAASASADVGGNAHVVGLYSPNSNHSTIRTWKYGPAGQLLWRHDYRDTDTAYTGGYFAGPTSDGGVYAVGPRIQTGSLPLQSFAVEKYDASGQRLWATHSDTSGQDYSYVLNAAAVDRVDNVLMVGRAEPRTGSGTGFVTMKFRASGGVEELGQARVAAGSAIMAVPSIVRGTCRLTLRSAEKAQALEIRDLAGRVVRSLPVSGAIGEARATWDATDEAGIRVPSGVYFVTCVPSGPCPAKLVVQR